MHFSETPPISFRSGAAPTTRAGARFGASGACNPASSCSAQPGS
jgi:hypothetical protein